jgi:hypothetical protein
LWHPIKNHIIVCRDILLCEDETLVVTPSKEDPSEYSTYDLRNQQKGRQVLIHQDEAAREVVEQQNENEQNGDAKTIQENVDEAQQDARSIQQDEKIQQDGEEGYEEMV